MTGSGTATTATVPSPLDVSKTLRTAMLETARVMGVVREGTATGGTTTTLIDTHLDEPADYYTKGTLWILDGSNMGVCDVVSLFAENEITIETTLANAIVDGDEYAIATPEFPKHKLRQAVLSVLRYAPILLVNDDLTADGSGEYDLPEGVHNIKRVDVGGVHQSWREVNDKLYFDGNTDPSSGTIYLYYEGHHGVIEEDDDILSSVDMDWLKWSAAVFLYRDKITRINKDNPTDLDLLNEAKVLEAEARRNANRFQLQSMPIDPKLAIW